MSESPTDLIIRILEEIEGAEDVIVCVRYKEKENGESEFITFSNEPPHDVYLQMLHYAIGAAYEEPEAEDE